MGLSMLIPAMSAAAALASIFARPRAVTRIVTGSIMLLLAVAATWFCWAVGMDDLEKFESFANSFLSGLHRLVPFQLAFVLFRETKLGEPSPLRRLHPLAGVAFS